MQSPIQPRCYISDRTLQPASKSGATQPVVILPGGWQIVLPGVAHYCIGMHTYIPLQMYTCICTPILHPADQILIERQFKLER